MKTPDTQKSKIRLSDLLCHRFYIAANAMVRAYRPLLEQLDITYPQYLVMLALWDKHKVEIGDIKQRTQIDGGALSLILKKLEAKGFIFLEKSEQDKRVKLVCLTEKGQALESQALPIPQTLACELEDIPKGDLQRMAADIDKLLKQIGS